MVGELLGATVTNEAVGASIARRGKVSTSTSAPYGIKGLHYSNFCRALSHTLAEKEDIINNWDKYKDLLSVKPDILADADKEFFKDCSYERRLFRHLSSKGGTDADLYVFDHGYNDAYMNLTESTGRDTKEQFTTVPADSRNRNTFIGSINYLIDIILENNPRSKIVFIGHYTKQPKSYNFEENIWFAQTTLAEYWKFPLFKGWCKFPSN